MVVAIISTTATPLRTASLATGRSGLVIVWMLHIGNFRWTSVTGIRYVTGSANSLTRIGEDQRGYVNVIYRFTISRGR